MDQKWQTIWNGCVCDFCQKVIELERKCQVSHCFSNASLAGSHMPLWFKQMINWTIQFGPQLNQLKTMLSPMFHFWCDQCQFLILVVDNIWEMLSCRIPMKRPAFELACWVSSIQYLGESYSIPKCNENQCQPSMIFPGVDLHMDEAFHHTTTSCSVRCVRWRFNQLKHLFSEVTRATLLARAKRKLPSIKMTKKQSFPVAPPETQQTFFRESNYE